MHLQRETVLMKHKFAYDQFMIIDIIIFVILQLEQDLKHLIDIKKSVFL